ncbi:unnamed protein product [Caenorhabditis auriculariae]|uniref:Uncharacterized protein n=1 Tax=Caenorhabditis auriculariae TaxID=2777116 RepID=A0A8S1HY75_9PELO|nr:unnamed protein product [Caenorhabditis auriculariae]
MKLIQEISERHLDDMEDKKADSAVGGGQDDDKRGFKCVRNTAAPALRFLSIGPAKRPPSADKQTRRSSNP